MVRYAVTGQLPGMQHRRSPVAMGGRGAAGEVGGGRQEGNAIIYERRAQVHPGFLGSYQLLACLDIFSLPLHALGVSETV